MGSGAAEKESMADMTPEQLEKEQRKLEKKEKKRLEKEAKASAKAARMATSNQREVIAVESVEAAQFGDMVLVQSQTKTGRQWVPVPMLSQKLVGEMIWSRGRLETIRGKGKVVFFVLRDLSSTVQVVLAEGDEVSREMVKYVQKVPPESIIDVYGELMSVMAPVESCSQKDVEVKALKVFVVSASEPTLPFQISDASTPLREDIEDGQGDQRKEEDEQMITVSRDVRLNNRWIDLRTRANQSIFRIQSVVGKHFRDFFHNRGFIEVHSPKIIGAASEGGSQVFGLKYFGKDAFLAQSPQLYKQMCICSDMKGVFEIGPVFRAEDSNTPRHLCEFVGLDFEMEIKEHYHEVLDTLGELFKYIFDQIKRQNALDLDIIRQQYPAEPLKYLDETLVIHFSDAIQMLHDAGATDADPFGDLTTPHEKLLGKLVREKYQTDFYIVDQYPSAARPFYTMPSPEDSRYSNSYDVFLRGEEITSGAQRIHDVPLLEKRAGEQNPPIPIHTIESYVNSFKYGAPPHGGAGIGLERVTMLMLGLRNIRLTSLFPRDPKRCNP